MSSKNFCEKNLSKKKFFLTIFFFTIWNFGNNENLNHRIYTRKCQKMQKYAKIRSLREAPLKINSNYGVKNPDPALFFSNRHFSEFWDKYSENHLKIKSKLELFLMGIWNRRRPFLSNKLILCSNSAQEGRRMDGPFSENQKIDSSFFEIWFQKFCFQKS